MFTLPLYDDNPVGRNPVMTWLLIILCLAVFLWQQTLSPRPQESVVYGLGLVPAVLFGYDTLPQPWRLVPGWATIFTSMFMHGSWLHLIGNTWFLWIFGHGVEGAMGHGRYLVFFLVSGIAAAFAQSLADPTSTLPMIGASGAIAGVLGAYLLLYPYANIRVLVFFLVVIRVVNVPALIVLGLWFLGQVLSGAATPMDEGGVAFWAHVGGFLAGVALVPLFRQSHRSLWSQPQSRPFQVMPAQAVRRGSVPETPYRPSGRGPWGGFGRG
ncbi:MAG: rhomboid family intramembrane serine protease [Proteobacteria bacterium]|nr:rhomboid family intramembrane serine protease [Pseudomonadota bacterium]MBI3499273.1 rhomboid family intramembrane serine protease [Pseudomonadota bacterium]